MSTELNSVNTKQEIEVNAEKRAFMKKAGKYAAVGAGMATLMSPTLSATDNYEVPGGKKDKIKARKKAKNG